MMVRRLDSKTVNAGTAPCVSVLMSVLNGARWLHESVESILAQSLEDFEFIIIDDGSRDESPDIVRKYQSHDARIRLILNEKNLGLAASLNLGLREARGRYIARHDADDVAMPWRLRAQVDYLENHPEVFLVSGSAVIIDEAGIERQVWKRPTEPAVLRRMLPVQNVMTHPAWMFRNDGQVLYREKFQAGGEDYDLLLRLVDEGKAIANLPEILLRYRLLPLGPVSRKRARYALFSAKASEFHQQRRRTGRDEYELFDPAPLMSVDPATSTDPIVLRALITKAFQQGNLRSTRELIRRGWQVGGGYKGYRLTYAATFFGMKVLEFVRVLKRLVLRDRIVLSLAESKRFFRRRELGLLFSTGDGLETFSQIGTVAREMALFLKLQVGGWGISLFTYDRSRCPPEPGFPARVHPQWPWVFPRGLNSLYVFLFPFLRYRAGRSATVLMTNQAHSGWPAILASRLWGARLVARCGWVFGANALALGQRGWRVALRKSLEKWTFRVADRCVIPTRELATYVVSNYGVPPEKIEIIPNYVDTDLFRPKRVDAEGKAPVDVLCVGRLTPQKRYDLILESVRRTEARVLIIGGGPGRAKMEDFAASHSINMEIIEKVENENLPSYINRAKVYVIASLREGHPKALIEAMACGCACVGTRSPGIENQIVDGQTGLLADSTPESLAEAIGRLLHDPALRAMLGEKARQYAVENFSLATVHGKYERLLSGLIERGV